MWRPIKVIFAVLEPCQLYTWLETGKILQLIFAELLLVFNLKHTSSPVQVLIKFMKGPMGKFCILALFIIVQNFSVCICVDT